MKVLIEIPQDHKRVIDNLVSDGKGYLLPQEVETRLARAVKIGTVIPDNATNGDMIKAMFQVVGYTPLSTWAEKKRKKSGFHVHIQGEFKTDFRLTVSEDWWNAPYKGVEND